jgi:membrane protease YdiL (CAAX protease family)
MSVKDAVVCFSTGAVSWVAYEAFDVVTNWLHWKNPEDRISSAFLSSANGIQETVFLVFLFCIIVPVSLEVFFRGFVFEVIKRRAGLLLSVVLCNLLYAIFYGGVNEFGHAFLSGCILTIYYIKSKSLCLTVAAHSIFGAFLLIEAI